ncbi:DNA (cytosine-5)-methyltransferase 1 [Microbacterium hydrothermale]|uniref:DNA cytosine methyltransferase n=1 Tax=Microbacterium hydrothermale TaxID=857427 RepID=UPI0022270DAE|nr:DNA (cytosine-5-)-methyltransferase [Microbacterium hydrothermale]MCW2165376.1 DNA (cytosine-5)-methyltransferase 1 [Microbacterium hydrothermale]
MNVLGLFAGIGGIELGLKRAGMHTVGLVERDAWCRRVLARHWPDAPQHDDVVTAPQWWASEPRPRVHVVAGGFPCQPFSTAGLQKGVLDERWMWPAMADVIRAVRPDYVLVENVAALVRDARAWGTVLADLHRLGFDAEWSTLSANQFGAPHIRERVYLVAYASSGDVPYPHESASPWPLELEPRGGRRQYGGAGWLPEPEMDRVAHGVSRGVGESELHALGNAVVPPIFEHIGRRVMAHAAGRAVAA